MSKKTLIRIGISLVLVFSILLVVNGVSEAQGGGQGQGGGRGQGGSAGGGRGGQGGRGMGMQTQQQQGNMLGGSLCCNLPPAVPGDVPADVVDALTAGLQDEYNAYAVYQAVIDQFGSVRPFVNIQRAEANHIASLEFLFERYSLTIPEPLSTTAPDFANLTAACAAGVEAEVMNLELYDQWIATVQAYPDMVQVFTSLRNASEFQHLPAFEFCAG